MACSNRKFNIHKLLTAVLALILVLSSFISVSAADFSGSCGGAITWSLQGGHLQISGSGAMPDYTETQLPPWYGYADSIQTIAVGAGITHVGNFAFMSLENVRTVILADSVLTVGSFAFYDCSGMERIHLSNSLTEIGRSAFERCRALKAVALPGSLRIIRSSAFYRCESLLSVTIPASVMTMEQKVFAYCKNLRTATILANIGEVPYWTFYGCYGLQNVSLSASIKEVGVSAFENCESLTNANYGGSGDTATSVMEQIQTDAPTLENFKSEENIINKDLTTTTTSTSTNSSGAPVTTQDVFFGNQNAVIETQKVIENNGVTVTVDAILENKDGWGDLDEQVTGALIGSANLQDVQVNVYLDPQQTVSGEDLARFEKKDIDIVLHTSQGATWHINGEDLADADLKESYTLSYTLRPLTNLTESQKKAVGSGAAYGLTFHGNIDFKVKVSLPLEQPRSVASFLSDDNGTYKLWQRVVIDDARMAQFSLGQVTTEQEYLIGISIPTVLEDLSDVVVPNPKPGVYVPMDWAEEVPLIITPPASSWGIQANQLTWILVGGMVVLIVVVGVVVKLVWNQKLKRGYIPGGDDDEDYEDE